MTLGVRSNVKEPANLRATAISNGQIAIAWDAPAGFSITQYELECSVDGLSGWTSIYAGSDPRTIHGALLPRTTYYYRVRALNGQGHYSPFSSVSSATTF